MARIKIATNGNLGNKVIQYLYCYHLRAMVPNLSIEHVQMPEFKMVSPDTPLDGRTLVTDAGHRQCMSTLAYVLNNRIYDNILFNAYVARLEYYPHRSLYSGLFRSDIEPDFTYLGNNYLLINVRGNEVLSATHPDYGPVPVDFFSQIADSEKLSPVIMGQIGDNAYSNEIRRRFAGCTIIPSTSAVSDFELLRNAAHVAIGVSTFSWIATWISGMTKRIHMPLSGIFNPIQRPDINLIPINDDRYRFYSFPVTEWLATPEQKADLISVGKKYRQLDLSEVRAMIL